jgi:hypothetical protein
MTKSHAPKRVIKKLRSEFPAEFRGNHCGVEQPGQFVATNAKEWKQMWEAAHSSMHPVPKAPKLPKGKIAIGIFTGQTSQRQVINVTSVESESGTTTVNWESGNAAAGGTIMTGMHENYLLKFIDKTDDHVVFSHKPAAPVSTPGGPGRLPQSPGTPQG